MTARNSGPVYDCGDPECTECQRAFGPDRSAAIAAYEARAKAYAEIAARTSRTKTQAQLATLKFDAALKAAISFSQLSVLAERGAINVVASNVSGEKVELCVMERKP